MAYTWSISSRRRNHNASLDSGNPRSKKMPAVVKQLKGHKKARASICAGCDKHLGRSAWDNGRATTLLKCSAVLMRQWKACMPQWDLKHRTLATSLCSSRISTARHPERKWLHLPAQKKKTVKSITAKRAVPGCMRFPKEACEFCDHLKLYGVQSKIGSPKSAIYVKRFTNSEAVAHKAVGRKRKGKRDGDYVLASSSVHRQGSGGRPAVLEQLHAISADSATHYDISHDLIFELGDAFSEATSDRALLRVQKKLRTSGKTVEPNLRDRIRERRNIFTDCFNSFPPDGSPLPKCLHHSTDCSEEMEEEEKSSSSATASGGPKKKKSSGKEEPCYSCRHPIAMCTNVQEFLRRFIAARGKKPSDVQLLKIGIDAGGKSLKFMLQLLFKGDFLLSTAEATCDADDKKWRKMLKDSGVRRVLLVAVAPNVAENYDNVNNILQKLKLEELEAFLPNARTCVAVDLKMMILMLGLKGAQAKFGCPYCCYSRWHHHNEEEEERTICTLTAESSEAAKKLAEGRKLEALDFHSSAGRPPMPLTQKFKNIAASMPLPMLHIMLGIVGSLYKEIHRLMPDTAQRWLDLARISTNRARGDGDFVCQQCQKIMKNLHIIEDLIGREAVVAF